MGSMLKPFLVNDILPNPGGDMQVSGSIRAAAGVIGAIGRGNAYFVDSVNGSANNDGKVPTRALITIDAAIGKCTANQGDVIYILPGHVETIIAATGMVLDIAGVSIIGLGTGSLRPTITFGTAAAATISITAANCVVSNLVLLQDYAGGLTAGITVAATGDGLALEGIELRDGSATKEFLIGISVAAACHAVTIDGLKYYGTAGGSTTQVVKFVGASNYSVVKNFLIYCDASGAAIDALTAASTWLTICNGTIHNLDTGAGLTVSVKSDTTGFLHDLRLSGLHASGAPAGAAMCVSEVYCSNVIFTQGFYQPVQDS